MDDDDAPFDLELWFGVTIEVSAGTAELLEEIFGMSWTARIVWATIGMLVGALALVFGLYLSYT